jgi:hypothetical protein
MEFVREHADRTHLLFLAYGRKNKNNSIRTDEPTPGTLALIGDSRASLSHIVAWVDHTGGRS